MSCTFAEAWSLLLSDPEVENTSYATERGTVNTQPSPTTSISSSSNEFSTLMSTARDPVLQHDLFDSASAARQCLTNLREQLQMLQHTSTSIAASICLHKPSLAPDSSQPLAPRSADRSIAAGTPVAADDSSLIEAT
ncbi:hypothetical protein ETB97_006999 [Aspergillus alliaceus]|uniref:Uncharacterized protein n=1 Tax=Petromyces alliaceus TaxID=209559 RepID=A0A8H5ZX65_PETAA|nr:hypothetical protein ETB97_006999 [Aspergillus burnettii]